MFNVISIQGRLTAKPEEKQAGSYKTARFSIAHQPTNKNKDVMYVNVVAWGKQCDFALKYLDKGNMVIVSGELDVSTFTGRDGTKKTTVSINANSIDSIGGKADANQYKEEQTRKEEEDFNDFEAWAKEQANTPAPAPTEPDPDIEEAFARAAKEQQERTKPLWGSPQVTQPNYNPPTSTIITIGPYAGKDIDTIYKQDPDWVNDFAVRAPMTEQELEQINIAQTYLNNLGEER